MNRFKLPQRRKRRERDPNSSMGRLIQELMLTGESRAQVFVPFTSRGERSNVRPIYRIPSRLSVGKSLILTSKFLTRDFGFPDITSKIFPKGGRQSQSVARLTTHPKYKAASRCLKKRNAPLECGASHGAFCIVLRLCVLVFWTQLSRRCVHCDTPR